MVPGNMQVKVLELEDLVVERRRGSVVESRTDANKEFIPYAQKQIVVRTPRRGRSKSIVINDSQSKPKNFPLGRLNNYSKMMKNHKGAALSMVSELESIDEGQELGERQESDSLEQQLEIGKDYTS